MGDPKLRLPPTNRRSSLKIYKSVVRGLNRNLKDKKDTIEAEKKLQESEFVDYLDNLSDEQRKKILNSKVKYNIPWRPVWNIDSMSTKCRLVFDASYSHKGEYSLNSLLVKGRNSMNRLVEVFIRWLIRRYAYHTDITKMYPSIGLKDDFWCYQLYNWDDELSLDREPRTKVIKTEIYGVKASGNSAERNSKFV